MLDLHEAMRALRFAPDPLLVLDSNRQVRVASRPVEKLLGISSGEIVGKSTDHLWVAESRPGFMAALNDAAQRTGAAGGAGDAVIQRLKAGRTWVDMLVSAWHPTDDPMYTPTKSPISPHAGPRTIFIHECYYTITLRDVGKKTGANADAGRKKHLTPPHSQFHPDRSVVELSSEATLSSTSSSPYSTLTTNTPTPPVSETTSSDVSLPIPPRLSASPSPPPNTLVDTLREGVIDVLDTAVFVLSVDGQTGVLNQRCVEMLGLRDEAGVVFFGEEKAKRDKLRSAVDVPDGEEPTVRITDGQVNPYFTKDPIALDRPDASPAPIRPSVETSPSPSALSSSSNSPFDMPLIFTDLDFKQRLTPAQHPLYRAATLGEVVREFRCGGVKFGDGSSPGSVSRRGSRAGLESRDEESPESVGGDGSTVQGGSPTQTFASLSSAATTEKAVPAYLEEPVDDTPRPGVSTTTRAGGIPFPVQHDKLRVPEGGMRLVLEITARPMRDQTGELVGGVMTIRDVTESERKRVESVRAESDLQFEQICDGLPQLVWTARPDGFVTYLNKGWYEFTGASRHESIGIAWQGVLHPDDMPATSRAWSHSLRTGDLYEINYRCRRRDGVWRWLVGRALPIRDPEGRIMKWLGTCTDIHDTIEALASSRRSQERLQSTLNHAAVTLWAVDRDMKITVAEGPGVRQLKLLRSPQGSSSSARSDHSSSDMVVHPHSENSSQQSKDHSHSHRTRRRNDSMLGRSIYEAWDPSLIQAHLERALTGEKVVQEMEIEGRWFRTQYTPLRMEWDGNETEVKDDAETEDDQEIVGVVGASMDITERKLAEERLRESFAERSRLLASETAAKEASRLKSQFLANMSHEIRTPIAGVIGLSELLCDTLLNSEQRGIAENIQRSADALLTVINDILDFSKVEMGKLDIDNTPFSLGVVILDTKKMLSFATAKKGLTFRDEVHLGYTGRVVGDPGRLRQVLTNLLTNSIKFTSHGSITLRAIEESEDDQRVSVRFSVEDEGVGIADSIRERLFQPFSQADSSTARRYGGTGLGLTISKNLVELMGGSIGLDSQEGLGTCAWFSVPFKKAREDNDTGRSLSPDAMSPDELLTPLSPVGPGSLPLGSGSAIESMNVMSTNGLLGSNMVDGMAPRPAGSLQRPREGIWILVAEDNLINQQIALKTLRKMNFNAEAVDNGKEVLVAMEKRAYDLVLMDCQMPEMDGYEATMCIRQLESVELRSVPIIAMTASAIRGDREKCLTVGMSDYLAKPVKRKALEAMILRWLYDEAYRQELSRWISPPSRQSTAIPPTPTPSPSLKPADSNPLRPSLTSPIPSTNSVASASAESVHSDSTVRQIPDKDGTL